MRTYILFGNLLEFLHKNFPSQNNSKISHIILELLEILADEDYYDKVVIEEANKRIFFTFLSKELKSNVIMISNQSCSNLNDESKDDQKYKYLVWF